MECGIGLKEAKGYLINVDKKRSTTSLVFIVTWFLLQLLKLLYLIVMFNTAFLEVLYTYKFIFKIRDTNFYNYYVWNLVKQN